MNNGQQPEVVHQIVVQVLDNGQVVAQTTMPALATMKVLSIGQGLLADEFQKKSQHQVQIVQPEQVPGLIQPPSAH